MNPEADFNNCIKTLRNSQENKGLEQEKARGWEEQRGEKAKDEVSNWSLGPVQGGSRDLTGSGLDWI